MSEICQKLSEGRWTSEDCAVREAMVYNGRKTYPADASTIHRRLLEVFCAMGECGGESVGV